MVRVLSHVVRHVTVGKLMVSVLQMADLIAMATCLAKVYDELRKRSDYPQSSIPPPIAPSSSCSTQHALVVQCWFSGAADTQDVTSQSESVRDSIGPV